MFKLRIPAGIALILAQGCAAPGQFLPGLKSNADDWHIKSVDSTGRAGNEFRQSDSGTELNRWTAQTGFEASTYNGHKFGVDYRRRDIDDGMGRNDGHDDGVWFTWSIPVWVDTSRPSKEKELERRVAELEKRLKGVHETE